MPAQNTAATIASVGAGARSRVTAVSLWLINTLGINYGTAPYQFKLGSEAGLKWLTYAGTLARQAAERDGHVVTITPF